jgi:hypothetical protein
MKSSWVICRVKMKLVYSVLETASVGCFTMMSGSRLHGVKWQDD